MADEFTDKIAVVTGAARGIGRSIAEHLHARGARLILIDINAEDMAETASSMRASGAAAVHTIAGDLSDPAVFAKIAGQIRETETGIDILINNAGIELELPFRSITAEAFDRVIAVNLRAPLLLTQALEPLFPLSGGAVVNISSIHSEHAFPNAIPYACSKAGLKALARNMALELAPRRIRVNSVCPGYIDTPMWEEWLRISDDAEALASSITALHPLGRRGMPADVASAVLYLASTEAAWITGTFLVIDGGLTIRVHP